VWPDWVQWQQLYEDPSASKLAVGSSERGTLPADRGWQARPCRGTGSTRRTHCPAVHGQPAPAATDQSAKQILALRVVGRPMLVASQPLLRLRKPLGIDQGPYGHAKPLIDWSKLAYEDGVCQSEADGAGEATPSIDRTRPARRGRRIAGWSWLRFLSHWMVSSIATHEINGSQVWTPRRDAVDRSRRSPPILGQDASSLSAQ
jgi:hypothetical protein